MVEPILVGRSSSHFTRVARIFATELGVAHALRAVLDIASTVPADYGDNPALKMPVLVDEHGPLFGTENVCREIVRRSGRAGVVLRGDVPTRMVANAEELTVHVMLANVTLVGAKLAGLEAPPKVLPGLERSLAWLDENVAAALAALPPERVLSFLEVAVFCGVTHLPFRRVTDVARFSQLGAFCARFGERESARATEYRFDAGADVEVSPRRAS